MDTERLQTKIHESVTELLKGFGITFDDVSEYDRTELDYLMEQLSLRLEIIARKKG